MSTYKLTPQQHASRRNLTQMDTGPLRHHAGQFVPFRSWSLQMHTQLRSYLSTKTRLFPTAPPAVGSSLPDPQNNHYYRTRMPCASAHGISTTSSPALMVASLLAVQDELI